MKKAADPQIFIETLASMLELERDRKAVRLLSQNRAVALKFMSRYSAGQTDDYVAVDSIRRRAQTSQRYLGQLQTQELDFDNSGQDPS